MAAAVLAAVTAATVAGCWGWSAPVGDPATPETITETPTPLDDARVELAAEACGTTRSIPQGDTSFAGEASWSEFDLPNGMTVLVSVRVPLAAEHGDHTVDLTWTSGTVTGPDGTVVGVTTAIGTPGEGSSSGAALSSVVYATLGACADDETALGDPLPDGDYQLTLSGLVAPVDHDHAVQEYWVANPVSFEVVDGEIVMELPADG